MSVAGGAYGDVASNLVSQPLGRDERDLLAHPLVSLEVAGEPRVVLLDDHPRRPLGGLCPHASLQSGKKRAQRACSPCPHRPPAAARAAGAESGAAEARGAAAGRTMAADEARATTRRKCPEQGQNGKEATRGEGRKAEQDKGFAGRKSVHNFFANPSMYPVKFNFASVLGVRYYAITTSS